MQVVQSFQETMISDESVRSPSWPNQGQRERKGGASAHRTLYGHLAAMRGHYLLHDIESQPRASRFRGMQRLKNLGEVLRGNAAAGILHGEGHGRGLPSPLEGPCASLPHRVD